jgi:hypothetical protein
MAMSGVVGITPMAVTDRPRAGAGDGHLWQCPVSWGLRPIFPQHPTFWTTLGMSHVDPDSDIARDDITTHALVHRCIM